MSPGSTHRDTLASGDILTAISQGMVALLKEFYGRGPTRAKTYFQDDLVVCVLRGGFSQVERTLLDGGRGAAVIQQRMEFQEVMRDRFVEVIERIVGRRVIGFMSGNQQDPDLMCEVFILDPSDLVEDGPSGEGALADRRFRAEVARSRAGPAHCQIGRPWARRPATAAVRAVSPRGQRDDRDAGARLRWPGGTSNGPLVGGLAGHRLGRGAAPPGAALADQVGAPDRQTGDVDDFDGTHRCSR